MSLLRSIRILAAVPLLVWLAAGCSAPIKLHDREQFAPAGRASYEFWPGIDERRRGALLDLVSGSADQKAVEGEKGEKPVTARSHGVRPTIAIDTSITYVEGHDRPKLRAGKTVELSGVSIVGPTRLETNGESWSGTLAARGGVRFFDVLSLEGILGIDLQRTRVRARGAGKDVSEARMRGGILMGGRVTLRPIPLFDLYAQSTYARGVYSAEEDQVGVELHVTRNVYVFGGYRWWRYREFPLNRSSDVKIRIRGPTAGLGVSF